MEDLALAVEAFCIGHVRRGKMLPDLRVTGWNALPAGRTIYAGLSESLVHGVGHNPTLPVVLRIILLLSSGHTLSTNNNCIL